MAKAYQAACTPEFYVFGSNLELTYHGQYDSSRCGSQAGCPAPPGQQASCKDRSGGPQLRHAAAASRARKRRQGTSTLCNAWPRLTRPASPPCRPSKYGGDTPVTGAQRPCASPHAPCTCVPAAHALLPRRLHAWRASVARGLDACPRRRGPSPCAGLRAGGQAAGAARAQQHRLQHQVGRGPVLCVVHAVGCRRGGLIGSRCLRLSTTPEPTPGMSCISLHGLAAKSDGCSRCARHPQPPPHHLFPAPAGGTLASRRPGSTAEPPLGNAAPLPVASNIHPLLQPVLCNPTLRLTHYSWASAWPQSRVPVHLTCSHPHGSLPHPYHTAQIALHHTACICTTSRLREGTTQPKLIISCFHLDQACCSF